MRTWTPEAKAAQAEAIRRWQPWKNSTGPKTEGGKARTRMNAEKHGQYNARDIASRREMRKILGRQMQFLKSVRLSLRLQKNLKTQERTIMTEALIAEGQGIIQAFLNWKTGDEKQNAILAHPWPDHPARRAA